MIEQPESGPEELLRRSRVSVAPATFSLVGLRQDEWALLLEHPELSPRPEEPFMFLKDAHEVTLLVEESDWRAMRHLVRDAKVIGDFRLLTFDIELDWNVVGFLAHVTRILADAGISAGALSAFSRDHLLIRQENLGRALRVLGEHVAELC